MINSTPSHPDAVSYVSVADANTLLTGRYNAETWASLTDAQKEGLLVQASRQIDSYRFFHNMVFPAAMYYRRAQALKFPRSNARKTTGMVNSAGVNYIVASNLANQVSYPDDFWNEGALVIINGTGKGQTLQVSDFEMATGKVTVSSNFSTQPDTTSEYMIIERIPLAVKYAVIEQVLYILNGGGERAKMQAENVKSYSIGDLSETFGEGGVSGKIPLSVEAKGYLKPFITRIGQIVV